MHIGKQGDVTRTEIKAQLQLLDTVGFPFGGTDVRTCVESEGMTEPLSWSS